METSDRVEVPALLTTTGLYQFPNNMFLLGDMDRNKTAAVVI